MFVNDVRFILCSPREIQILILVFVPLKQMNYYYCSSKLCKLYDFLSFEVMFLVNSDICARMGQEFGESIIYLKIHYLSETSSES